jgi:large subunit ribosomal protein L1
MAGLRAKQRLPAKNKQKKSQHVASKRSITTVRRSQQLQQSQQSFNKPHNKLNASPLRSFSTLQSSFQQKPLSTLLNRNNINFNHNNLQNPFQFPSFSSNKIKVRAFSTDVTETQIETPTETLTPTETIETIEQKQQQSIDFADAQPDQTVNEQSEAQTSFYMGPNLFTERPQNVAESLRIVRAFCNSPNDQNIYIALNLGLDPRKPNQMVRGLAPVPHGSGNKQILAVFATGEKASEARDAGADIVGGEELIKEIASGGKIEFTRCIATPDMMKHLSKVARILGPKGLMPNPKLGTVTTDVLGAINNSKLGQIEFRCDKKGVVHAVVGKASWPVSKLQENCNAFIRAIDQAKPSGAKGQYFKSAFIGCNQGMSQLLDTRLYPFKI